MAINHYDLIIIGTGAGGGTLAHALAPTGKRILILERGSFLPQEKDNWIPVQFSPMANIQLTKLGWIKTANPSIRASTIMSAAIPRFMGRRFCACGRRILVSCAITAGFHRRGRLAMKQMEPYYTKAEHLYEVHGEHGVDPTEGPASADYAFPPVSHEPRIQQLSDDLKAIGHHPFHLPLGCPPKREKSGH